ncbi:hypothetical protein M7I_3940 [Glarea lozoyensis 74030]|uniref:Alginate lyase 2 domain-containing protein n=1 Tax=Glarea lozoyensis (strain ATCC 74030 / MF5533) TaxID=1104152 RepID=H0EMU2_GLAL7|nr:hypothetical protein M7I_3940 [Glarea lozoyensis 74030]
MKVIGSPASTGCVTTKNSKHCRTELREIKPSSWDPNAKTNRLNATIQVTKADDSNYGTVIGQIHIDDSISTKPVCELYYNKAGVITMGVEKTRAGGSSIYTQVGNVPVGTKFDYAIIYEKNVLGVTINGGKLKTLSTNELDAPKSYFKPQVLDTSSAERLEPYYPPLVYAVLFLNVWVFGTQFLKLHL